MLDVEGYNYFLNLGVGNSQIQHNHLAFSAWYNLVISVVLNH